VTTMPEIPRLPDGHPRLAAGIWRVDPGRFQSEMLAWVPTGWRAVGRLQVKGTEYGLACRFGLRLDDPRPGCPPRLKVACTLVIDSRWITRQWIPALDRRIEMTCSLSLEPDVHV